MDELSLIRKNIKRGQKNLLNIIWDYHVQTKKWLPVVALPAKAFMERDRANAAIEKLNGSILYEIQGDDGRKRYVLTFLGVLLTKHGEKIEDTTVEFLHFVAHRLRANPEVQTIDSREVREFCIENEPVTMSGRSVTADDFSDNWITAIGLSPFMNGGTLGENWIINLPRDIDDVYSAQGVSSYFYKRILSGYDVEVPIDGVKRAIYLERKAKHLTPVKLTTEDDGKSYSYDVFLSYASADSKEANRIFEAIEAAGGRGFLSEKTLEPGVDFAEQIRSAIRTSREMWLLVSPNSLKSGYFLNGARHGC